MKCKDVNCSDLNQLFFSVKKTNENEYSLQQQNELPNFNNDYKQGFDVIIDEN